MVAAATSAKGRRTLLLRASAGNQPGRQPGAGDRTGGKKQRAQDGLGGAGYAGSSFRHCSPGLASPLSLPDT